ncbi:Egl nine homolog 1 [Eumeta japonica]|uniref:Egl nine homolog 1 n=1 Tax=Eumeta variegata TaxID=151549 RepID=A0A4C1TFG8_EUMVA|nr:Egl nine homolog 1 [Eumeta japonica]
MNQEVIVECCAVCNLKSSLRCAQCQNIYYCNRVHQRQDWKRHKSDCKKILNDTQRNCVTSPEKNNEINTVVSEETVCKFRHVEVSEKGTLPQSKSVEGTSEISSEKDQKTHIISQKDTKHSDKIVSNVVKHVENNVNKCNVEKTAKEYSGSDAITYEGSSENEILSTSAQQLSSPNYSETNSSSVNVLKTINRSEEPKMPEMSAISENSRAHKDYPEGMLRGNMAPFCHNRNTFVMDSTDPHYEICQSVIRDMTAYGVCVLDNFLGRERGMLVLKEVLNMYRSGIFQAGQLVSNPGRQAETQTIRSDRITWIDGKEPQCYHIGQLIQQVDNIILRANKLPNNGKMGDYIINGRTKRLRGYIGLYRTNGFRCVMRELSRAGPDLPYGFLGFSPGPRGFKEPLAKSRQSEIDEMRKNSVYGKTLEWICHQRYSQWTTTQEDLQENNALLSETPATH